VRGTIPPSLGLLLPEFPPERWQFAVAIWVGEQAAEILLQQAQPEPSAPTALRQSVEARALAHVPIEYFQGK